MAQEVADVEPARLAREADEVGGERHLVEGLIPPRL